LNKSTTQAKQQQYKHKIEQKQHDCLIIITQTFLCNSLFSIKNGTCYYIIRFHTAVDWISVMI